MSVICHLFFLWSYSYENCVSSEMFGPWECQALITSIHQTWHSLSLSRFSSKAPAVFTGELQVVDYMFCSLFTRVKLNASSAKMQILHLTGRGTMARRSTGWRPILEPSQVSSPPALTTPRGFGCTCITWLPGIKKLGRLLPAPLKQLPAAEQSALCVSCSFLCVAWLWIAPWRLSEGFEGDSRAARIGCCAGIDELAASQCRCPLAVC